MGVESIRDIPADFELTESQRRAATCVQTGEPWYDIEGLKTTLAALTYPLFFMDFETINPCDPAISRACVLMTTCLSSGRCMSRRRPSAEPEHYEFLATGRSRSALRVHHLALRSARRKRQHRCV